MRRFFKKIFKNEDSILRFMLVGAIIAVLVAAAGPELLKGGLKVVKLLFPTVWSAIGYLWVAIIAFCLGMKKGKKSARTTTP